MNNKLGYRMYSNKDLVKLQYILALKFLGLSLSEILQYVDKGLQEIQEVLSQQKIMMKDKKMQLETVISAIEATENLLETKQWDYKEVVNIIQAIKMELKPTWMNKYLTKEERSFVRDLAKKSYSKEALEKLAKRGWTQEQQQSYNDRYIYFRKELKRLIESEVDPGCSEAQEVGQF
ncbi:MAG TPA: hypothetical protein VIK72_02985 [Clostridiaceae bacterium]